MSKFVIAHISSYVCMYYNVVIIWYKPVQTGRHCVYIHYLFHSTIIIKGLCLALYT